MNEARYREAEARLWTSTGMVPNEHRLRLARTGVAVRVQEIGSGPPALFIHGVNTSGASWIRLASRLVGLRCLLLDRPGTGLSEPVVPPLTIDRLPAFAETLVVDVLDALELPTAHLVATSFGAYFALRTAAAHPDRVDRMTLFSWSAGTPIRHLPLFMRAMGLPGIGGLAARAPANERSIRALFRALGHGLSLDDGRIRRADLDAYLALLRDTATRRHELAMGRAFIHPVHGLDRMLIPDAVLGAIRAPTLLLWGEHDPFGGEDAGRRLVDRLPTAELRMLPGAGHAPWLDDLELIARETVAFLLAPSRRMASGV